MEFLQHFRDQHTHQFGSSIQRGCKLVAWLHALLVCLCVIAPLSVQAGPANLVKDIWPGISGSEPSELTSVNDTLYFYADDGTNGQELWKSDGTAGGTVIVKDIWPGSSSQPRGLTNVNGTLYFFANDGIHGRELWKSDGTAAGTVLVKDINPSSGSSHVGIFPINVNGTLYFAADDGTHGAELWKSDGTAAGTLLVKDINPGSGDSGPLNFAAVNGTLFFVAEDVQYNKELWKTDGTATGTVLVKDINPGCFPLGVGPEGLTNGNGTLYFTHIDCINGRELWKSDGTEAGTMLVKDINPGSGSSVSFLSTANGTLYFGADDGTNGEELWKSDGTAAGTVLVKEIWPGSNGGLQSTITNVDGMLYFIGNDGIRGRELWKSDGTAAGTVMVKDILPGSDGSNPGNFTNVNGTLYFTADDGISIGLWNSDGTAVGTVRVQVIKPGGNQLTTYLTVAGTRLFFDADDGVHGSELWSLDTLQSPFGSTPWPIPGQIEMEDYDLGGQGIAYNDNTAGNKGGQYRTDDVDIWLSGSEGHYAGTNSAGEWLEFTVDVATSGNYQLELRFATPKTGRQVHVEFGGVNVSGPITLPNTGGWQAWQTLTVPVALTAGEQVMRVVIDGNGMNLNWVRLSLISVNLPPELNPIGPQSIEEGLTLSFPVTASDDGPAAELQLTTSVLPTGATFTDNGDGTGEFNWTPGSGTAGTYNVTFTVTDTDGTGLSDSEVVEITVNPPGGGQSPFGGVPWALPGKVEMEDYDLGGEGIAYHDTTAGNKFGQYRTDDVDIKFKAAIGHFVGAVRKGEWLEFTVDVASSGNYKLRLRVATKKDGRRVHVEFNGVDVTGKINIPNTGGSWKTIGVPVTLTAGQQIMRVFMDTGGQNLNWIKIK